LSFLNNFQLTISIGVVGFLISLLKDSAFSLTSCQKYYGDIWNEIIAVVGSDNLRWMIYTTFAYSLLFGNNLSGFDGLIDLETRQKLWNVVIDRIKVNNGEKSIDSVKLKLPSENTKMLEDSSMDIS